MRERHSTPGSPLLAYRNSLGWVYLMTHKQKTEGEVEEQWLNEKKEMVKIIKTNNTVVVRQRYGDTYRS